MNDAINPLSDDQQREKLRKDRANAINLMCMQAEMLQTNFVKRREVDHSVFGRLVQSILKIVAHIKLDGERAHRFERKMQEAGAGDNFTVHVDGNRVYVEGFFDLNKLHQTMLW